MSVKSIVTQFYELGKNFVPISQIGKLMKSLHLLHQVTSEGSMINT